MPDPDPKRDTGGGPDRGRTVGTPRWVKVFGVIAIVLVVLVVVMLVTGGGKHGPGRHTGAGDRDGQTAPSIAGKPGGDGGHRPPTGGHTP